jgi:hypothetical protein
VFRSLFQERLKRGAVKQGKAISRAKEKDGQRNRPQLTCALWRIIWQYTFWQVRQTTHEWLSAHLLLHEILDNGNLGMIALLKPIELFCGSPFQLKLGS